jgi:predicted NBD/HSP70 family sugar kinase
MVEVFRPGRVLRPSTKVLPEDGRGHNRSLVLQTLYRSTRQSRADIARSTLLTRVTVSDLVAELIEEGLVVEIGPREHSRPGKPATLLDINHNAFQIVGIDLSGSLSFRGAVLDLDGEVIKRAEVALDRATGVEAKARLVELTGQLLALTSAPVLGVGIGSPGVVDSAGVVLRAPNLGWRSEPLQAELSQRFGVPVVVGNDARAAVLAEHSFGGADGDVMLIRVGQGVGSGLLLNGSLLFGSSFAAGEIGHTLVGTSGGAECACGKFGCLETWLAVPRLVGRIAAAEVGGRSSHDVAEEILRDAGRHLGIALAPVVAALNLADIVLSGPVDLLDGPLAEETIATIRARTMTEFQENLHLRMTTLGTDIVIRGAAVMVLSSQLGVS